MKSIYMDNAAATPVDPVVVRAMQPYLTVNFYNPSAVYLAARQVSKDIEEARTNISYWLGCKPSEIIFTAGGTEANNLAVQGIMNQFPDGNIIISAVEHESVIKPAQKYNCKVASVYSSGIVNLEDLANLIDDNTVLISVMLANNEIGTIEPISKIADLINQIKNDRKAKNNVNPLYLHTDACQAASTLDLHVSRLGIDLLSLNAGKIYGPKQSGLLYLKSGVDIMAIIEGGGQEKGHRSGTENVSGIIGLAKALDLVQSRRKQEIINLYNLQKYFFDYLTKKVPEALINGSIKNRLTSNVHIRIDGQDGERLMMQLDELGVKCAVGSACSASSDEPSHVLEAIGLNQKEIRSSLRFTFGHFTSQADIKLVVNAISRSIKLQP